MMPPILHACLPRALGDCVVLRVWCPGPVSVHQITHATLKEHINVLRGALDGSNTLPSFAFTPDPVGFQLFLC